MSLLGWLLEKRSGIEEITTLARPASWLIDYFGGGRSKAGVNVDATVVMTVAAFYRGVSIRTNALAMLPLDVRMYKGASSQTASRHWAYDYFGTGITPDHVNFAWFKLMEHNRIIRGNAYALMIWDGAGKLLSMPPIHPDRICAKRDADGKLWYEITKSDGGKDRLEAWEVFHIAGSWSEDGITGKPLIDMMRESVGSTLAMQEHGSRLFSNGARIGGILKHPSTISSDEVASRIRKSFEDLNSGLANAHRTALLEEGMDWQPVTLSAIDAQFIEGRRFEVTEAARWLELPPHMIADLEKASFNNMEQQGQDFKTHTMLPSIIYWEQMLGFKVFTKDARKRYFFKFNLNALARADMPARTAYYKAGRELGWLNPDEIRELEDMGPLPDGLGQEYLRPMNMMVLGSEQPAPAPPAAVPADDAETKKRALQALHCVFESELSKVCTREANSLRNLCKKSAKTTNFEGFSRDLSDFAADSAAFLEKVMLPCARALGQLTELTDAQTQDRLKKFAKAHSSRWLEPLPDVALAGEPKAVLAAVDDVCSKLECVDVAVGEADKFLEVMIDED